jgi:transcription-repair coupling factor (superfamily II helicase)
MGFSPVSTVAEPGDYAIRGGIVDIYPPGPGGPVRLDFFGDVLDGARRFDPVSQRTVEKLTQVEFAPVSEVVLDEAAITRFRQNYRVEFGAAGTDDPLYEAVSAGRKHQGMEHWLPFFHDRLETLFDYLPDAAVMLDDQVTPMRLARWEGSTMPMTPGPRRWRRRGGWTRSTSRSRRGCCIWTMPPGRRRWPATG